MITTTERGDVRRQTSGQVAAAKAITGTAGRKEGAVRESA